MGYQRRLGPPPTLYKRIAGGLAGHSADTDFSPPTELMTHRVKLCFERHVSTARSGRLCDTTSAPICSARSCTESSRADVSGLTVFTTAKNSGLFREHRAAGVSFSQAVAKRSLSFSPDRDNCSSRQSARAPTEADGSLCDGCYTPPQGRGRTPQWRQKILLESYLVQGPPAWNFLTRAR